MNQLFKKCLPSFYARSNFPRQQVRIFHKKQENSIFFKAGSRQKIRTLSLTKILLALIKKGVFQMLSFLWLGFVNSKNSVF